MPILEETVEIKVKKKEKELIPSACVYAFGDTKPKLALSYTQIVYKGTVHTPYLNNLLEVRTSDPVTANATIKNETGNGQSYKTLLLVGYLVEDKLAVLARSKAVILRDGESQDFITSFTMEDESWAVVLVSIHYTGVDRAGCPIEMSKPIYITPKPQESGQPTWKYVSEPYWVDSTTVRIAYEIGSPRTEQWGDSFRYIYTPYLELNGTPAIRGMQLSSGNTTGAFKILKSRLDTLGYMATLTLKETDRKEDKEVKIDEVTREVPSQGNKFIITTPRDDNISVVKIIKVQVFNFNIIDLESLLLNLVLECTAPPCTFELTEANGLEEGEEYAFISSHSINPGILAMINVPNESIYRLEGVQNIEVEPIIDIIAETFCTLLGIDSKSTVCLNEILTLADPLYIADAISRTLYNTNLVGDVAYPDALDIPFVALALATGAVPAGGAGKKLFGKILKGARNPLTRELNDVGIWIERHMDLISASILRGFKSDVELAMKRIASAADAVPGSPEQDALLKQAKDLMEETIKGTDYRTAITRSEAWINRITDQLGIAQYKTPPKEVISKGKVKEAIDHIPGLGKLNLKDIAKFKEAARKGGVSDDVIDSLERLEADLITGGKMPKTRKALYKRIFAWSKEHKLATGTIVGVVFCMWWWGMDNAQYIFGGLLRRAGVIDNVWGDQWDDYTRDLGTLYFKIKDDPCDKTYQRDYVHLLGRLRDLIAGADPIPEGKIDQAKYLFNVVYGRDIGDPNVKVKEDAEFTIEGLKHWYYELVRGCSSPILPEWVKDEYVELKFEYVVKVQRVLDGDTVDVTSIDPDWPFDESESVRVLGVDTPDPVKDGYNNILGYEVRRKPLPEKEASEDLATPVTKDEFTAATNFTKDRIDHQFVTIRIDPLNIRGKHGRLLATFKVDNELLQGDLGQALLKDGHAMVFFYTPNALMDAETRGKYLAAEVIARDAKLGVWSGEAEALPTGKIKCDSTPGGAYIYLDEETAPRGATDTTLDDITIGNRGVAFRGLTYSGVECKDCECGYFVDVKKDERELVMCNMTSICEIKQPKWEDESGIRWDVFPSIWLDDGLTKSSLGSPDTYPFEITFGKTYTGLGIYTVIQNGPSLLARDCDHGEWTIEMREDGYKTLSSTYNFKPGIYKRLIPKLEKGSGDGGEIPEEVPEVEPEVGVGYLTIKRPIIAGTSTEVPGNIKVHIDGLYIRRYAGAGTTQNIKCCSGCYCNDDKDLGDCSLGTHTLMLKKTDYEIWSGQITLVEGETTEVTAEMTPADGTVTGAIADIEAKDIYADAPSRFSARIVNTGTKTACYRMKFNFNGISPEVIGWYYEYPIRFEDAPDDGWSVGIEPGKEVVVAVSILLPTDAIPTHAETARYEIGTELQVAEIF